MQYALMKLIAKLEADTRAGKNVAENFHKYISTVV